GYPVLNDLGAEGSGRGHLGRVGVLGNEDQSRQPDGGRRERHRLGVVAGADRDHARRPGAMPDQREHRVERASRLEGAGDLEALWLEAQRSVEVGRERRRPPDVAADSSGRLRDLIGVLLEKRVHLRGPREIPAQPLISPDPHAAAESRSSAASRGRLRRRFVSTMPARITTMPATIVALKVSCSSTTPQKTAVTGTRNVTPPARTAPRLFIT